MPENSHQTLPCGAFFFAQSAAQVRDDEQLVGNAVFPEYSMADGPAPMLPRKSHLQGLRPARFKKFMQAQFFRAESQHARRDAPQ